MMSCACGLNDSGNIFLNCFGFSNHLIAICGDTDDVIHVSNTSRSGLKSEQPHLHFCDGFTSDGSKGNSDSEGSITSPHFLQYQAGIGTP